MSEYSKKALLPEGFRDDLAPGAEREARVVGDLLAEFSLHGYNRVDPPIVEFEASLLASPGSMQSESMFRLMDPVSKRMMAVRSDMTHQIARIASTRLATAPRPLRLCYAGPVLRVQGTQLRHDRQLSQAGIELFGSDLTSADLEVILLAVRSLKALGASGVSVDFCLPVLVSLVAEELGLGEKETAKARLALDAKDIAALDALPNAAAQAFGNIVRAAGPVESGLEALDALELSTPAKALVRNLTEITSVVRTLEPDIALTIDPGESSGFEYQTGICFTIFADGARAEVGRGGRYLLAREGGYEGAVGVTLYVHNLISALGEADGYDCVYLPANTGPDVMSELHERGLRTVFGLDTDEDAALEAGKLGCTHIWIDGEMRPI